MKRTVLELTVSTDYVSDWGIWQGLRELLQNAVDADDLGYTMTVSHRHNANGVGVVRIVNEGICMKRDALLLGTTTKRGDDRQRGEFGEGFKLAWLALLRGGARIKVKSGDEIWVPTLEHSPRFGSDLIRVRCKPAAYDNKVICYVEGVSTPDWELVKSRLLFLSPPKKADEIAIGNDRILTGEQYQGHFYARGIYVGRLPGRYRYGYDLYSVKLDRDRGMADPWDLRYRIQDVLNSAVCSDKLSAEQLYDLAQDATFKEAESISQYSGAAEHLARVFRERHGETAVPVRDFSASTEADQCGLTGIVVSSALADALSSQLPDLEKAKAERVFDVRHRHSAHELTADERETFAWAAKLCNRWTSGVQLVVVDFIGEDVAGCCGGNEVRIARHQLGDRTSIVSTLVHELAHHEGGDDGSVEHRRNLERIFATIIAENC